MGSGRVPGSRSTCTGVLWSPRKSLGIVWHPKLPPLKPGVSGEPGQAGSCYHPPANPTPLRGARCSAQRALGPQRPPRAPGSTSRICVR